MERPLTRRVRVLARALPLGLLAACGPFPGPIHLDEQPPQVPDPLPGDPTLPGCADLTASVRGLLEDNCSGCHGTNNAKGGLSNITDLTRLVTDGPIVRGDAEASLLYQMVASGEMPQSGGPLTTDQVATIGRYIDTCTADGGAPSPLEAPDCRDQGAFVPTADVLERILGDLIEIKLERRKVTRYMSLVHLRNAGYCDAQIDAYRFALSKLINSLSRGPRIVQPTPIDDDRLIYRIDLLDLEWTPEIWKGVVEADPYAITYLGATADAIRTFTGADVFVQQADWFIDAASRPPLYHDILELPATLAGLEAQLGIDRLGNIAREAEFDTDGVLRACFRDSGVSENNRCIERHEIAGSDNRHYWISYDFADNDPAKLHNVFLAPLTFVPDGGEVIFNLPNGLQAYMIVDAAGARIDEAPTTIVRDHENDGEAVVNGISCMGCHNEGMRLHPDQVRDAVLGNTEFDVLTQEQVGRLYTGEPLFTERQRDNIQRFAESLALTGSPLLVADMEPTIAVHNAFDQDLDLDRAAAEFGVPRDQLLKNLSALQGLEVLDVSTVDRPTFADNFAANACILNLGVTVACPDAALGDTTGADTGDVTDGAGTLTTM